MMTQGYNESSTQIFYGLSSDTKPTGCDNGSIFIEMDTKIGYIYDAANADWTEIPNGGGSQVEMDYNEATNKPAINDVTLSGNKTPASLGLQTKINSDSMLDADLVDDTNSDNKFVSATDIVNWNGKADADDVYTKTYMDTALAGKQAVIDDLSDIRSGAALGATSLQPSDVKSTYSSSGTDPVNGKAVAAAIGTLDVAAVGGSGSFISGISETNGKISATAGTVDSTPTESSTGLVTSAGIYTDQARQDALEAQDRAALIEVENKGAKNYCPKETETSTGSGFTEDVAVNIPAGTYILSFTGTLAYTASISFYRALPHSGNNLLNVNLAAQTGEQSIVFTIAENAKYIAFYHNGSGNSLTNIMICTKAAWDISHQYEPYALPNPPITAKMIENVDGGVKNLSQFNSGTAAADNVTLVTGVPLVGHAGEVLVFSYETTLSSGIITVGFKDANGNATGSVEIGNVTKQKIVTIPKGTAKFNVFVSKAGTYTNFMICTLADWNISHKYVPYKQDITWGLGDKIPQNSDFNSYTIPGVYRVENSTDAATMLHIPVTTDGGRLEVSIGDTSTEIFHTYFSGNSEYRRSYNGTTWSDWVQILSTATLDEIPTANSTNAVMSGGVQAPLAELVDNGAKNHFPAFETKSYDGVTYTYSNGTVTATGTKTGALNYIEVVENRPISELGFSVGDTLKLFNTSGSLLLTVILGNGTTFDPAILVGNETKELTIGAGKTHIYVRSQILTSVTGAINLSATPMICTKTAWDASHQFEPYALPNPVITPALIELVDGGAKNVRNITLDELKTLGGNAEFSWSGNVATKSNVSFTINADGTITVDAAQAASAQVILDIYRMPSDASDMVLSGAPAGGDADSYFQYVKGTTFRDYGEGVLYSKTGAHSIGLVIAQGYRPQNLTFKPMICTAADYAVSPKFVPYAMNNAELTAEVKNITPTIIKDQSTSVGTSYTLISSLTQTTTAGKLCKISAIIAYRNYRPRGIVLSYSEDSSNFDTGDKLIAKTENTGDTYELSASAIISRNNVPVYVWAKAATAGTERIYSIMEQLGDL